MNYFSNITRYGVELFMLFIFTVLIEFSPIPQVEYLVLICYYGYFLIPKLRIENQVLNFERKIIDIKGKMFLGILSYIGRFIWYTLLFQLMIWSMYEIVFYLILIDMMTFVLTDDCSLVDYLTFSRISRSE